MANEKEPRAATPPDVPQVECFDRMSAANQAARRDRLRALTLEAALREFEELCREIHALHEGSSGRLSHPVGLIKYTRRS
jgi:hypothetical protein